MFLVEGRGVAVLLALVLAAGLVLFGADAWPSERACAACATELPALLAVARA